MYLYKITIVLLLTILIYVLFCLLIKRRQIMIGREGLTNSAGLKEIENLKSSDGPGFSSVENPLLPLREYCVKSSYNTALSGQYVSTDMIKYVLTRGCRFLDFEIFFIKGGPCVAYSTDPTFVTITSQNNITLTEALRTVIENGFSGPSPNLKDPIFIQFRIKSTNLAIYNMIGMAVHNILRTRLYTEHVDGSTPLNLLLGSIVLIVDKRLSPDYSKSENYSNCSNQLNKECYLLSKYTAIESGSGTLRMYSYQNLTNQATTPPTILNPYNTDISLLRLVVPTYEDSSNPNSADFIENYGVQFISNRFYLHDKGLTDYENFFYKNKSALVPFSTALQFLYSNNE